MRDREENRQILPHVQPNGSETNERITILTVNTREQYSFWNSFKVHMLSSNTHSKLAHLDYINENTI